MIVPPLYGEDAEHRRALGQAARELIDGHGNNGGTIAIASTDTSTVVADARVGTDSVIVLVPTDAAGATEFGAGSMYVSSRGKGTFTIVTSATAAIRSFTYAVLATGYTVG